LLYILATLLLLGCVYLPSLWVRWVMHKHGKQIQDMPGTGGELAEHLLRHFDLKGYKVEQALANVNHFDPSAQAVRLSPENYAGKSLTAIAVAAHEVGHALQHHRQEKIFELRKRYLPTAKRFERVGVLLLWALPILGFLLKTPAVIFGVIALSLTFQLIGALSYLIVLPEEWDASFNKALPILIEGEYIQQQHVEPVRSVLKAAALTYFAGALANVLNIGRWLMVLIRR